MKQLYAIYKLIISYFKRDWEFNDYPLTTWKSLNAIEPEYAYGAGFVNWPGLIALGDSPQKAKDKLIEHFNLYKINNKNLPRPGTKVPFEYADTIRIEQLEETAAEFFDAIIKIDFYQCFISDFSSLHDFALNNEETYQKIKDIYGVDVGKDAFIVDILESIERRRREGSIEE